MTFVAECAEVGQIEKPAKLEGRTLTAIIAPKKNNLGGIYHAKMKSHSGLKNV